MPSIKQLREQAQAISEKQLELVNDERPWAEKREEYDHRVTYREGLSEQLSSKSDKPTSWLAFVKDNCPQCPALKSKLPLLPFAGTIFNVGEVQGFDAAVTHEVMATPTLILIDENGNEVLRITSALDWNRVEAAL